MCATSASAAGSMRILPSTATSASTFCGNNFSVFCAFMSCCSCLCLSVSSHSHLLPDVIASRRVLRWLLRRRAGGIGRLGLARLLDTRPVAFRVAPVFGEHLGQLL